VRRALRGVAATLVATAGAVLLHAPAAHATAPDQTGWWSYSQPSSGLVPNVTADPGQLEIVGGPSGPVSFAAVRYTVPPELDGQQVDLSQVTGTLVLSVAPNSSAQGASLQVCPTASPWKPEEHGAMSDAPKYNCATPPVTGQVSPDNNTVTFNLVSSLASQPGTFDLAIVPSGQAPFAVKFAKPDERSFAPSAPPAVPGSTDTGAATQPPAPLSPDTTPAAPTLAPASPALSSPASEVPLAAGPAANPSTPTPPGPPSLRLRPAGRTSSWTSARQQQVMAVGLLLAIAGALWWMGGVAQAAPKLLGSLGGRKPDTASATVRIGGVGRFARPRTAAPRPI